MMKLNYNAAEFYKAHLARDPRFDGKFFVAVKTTKIYCRPICPARKAKLENLEFFIHAMEAEAAGATVEVDPKVRVSVLVVEVQCLFLPSQLHPLCLLLQQILWILSLISLCVVLDAFGRRSDCLDSSQQDIDSID